MYPKTFFQAANLEIQNGKCFVLMPFANDFDKVYDAIREAVEGQEATFNCERADDVRGGGHIMESVLRKIAESEIVIADLTGKNPNVFYELGIAHMVKPANKVILLIQENDTLPFDLAPFRSIIYNQGETGVKQLKVDLQNAIIEVAEILKFKNDDDKEVYQFGISQGKVYSFPVKLFGEGSRLYDFEILAEYIGGDGIKFMFSMTSYAAGKEPKKTPPGPFGMGGNGIQKIPNIPWNLKLLKLSAGAATFQLIHV